MLYILGAQSALKLSINIVQSISHAFSIALKLSFRRIYRLNKTSANGACFCASLIFTLLGFFLHSTTKEAPSQMPLLLL